MAKDSLSRLIYGTSKGIRPVRMVVPRKRDIQRAVNPYRRVREPIPAEIRKELLKLAKGRCQYLGCSIKEGGDIKLQVHHKNMENDDNNISNLMLLCATHHGVKHNQEKRIVEKDFYGGETNVRVVSREKAKQIKKQQKEKRYNPLGHLL